MNFVTRWVMVVKQELMMSLRGMEGTEVEEDEGSIVDPSQFWELSSFWTFWNICLTHKTVFDRNYTLFLGFTLSQNV